MITEALEHVIRGIVDHPDDVTVQTRGGRSGLIYEVRVHPEDIGRVIGRQGRTATAVRTVIGAISDTGGRAPRIDFSEKH